jgi:hypothetical protein
VFLVRFRSKGYAESPWRKDVGLDVSEAEEPVDRLLHDGDFMESIVRFFNCNGLMVASINNKFVAVYWGFDTVFMEDVPEFLDELGDAKVERSGSALIEHYVAIQFFGVLSCIEGRIKFFGFLNALPI